MAVLRKPGGYEPGRGLVAIVDKKQSVKKNSRHSSPSADEKALIPTLRMWLVGGDGYEISVTGGRINAVPKHMAALSSRLMRHLNVICHGVYVGDIKAVWPYPLRRWLCRRLFPPGHFRKWSFLVKTLCATCAVKLCRFPMVRLKDMYSYAMGRLLWVLSKISGLVPTTCTHPSGVYSHSGMHNSLHL